MYHDMNKQEKMIFQDRVALILNALLQHKTVNGRETVMD